MALLKKDKAKQSAMREALKMFRELSAELTDEQLARLQSNAAPILAGAEGWDKVAFPAHAMTPFTALQPLSADELAKVSDRTKGILGAVVAGFSAKIPQLLERLAADNPEKALKMYLEMQEFLVPKLQRTETTGTIEHQATFVAVEARDADPRTKPALPGPRDTNNTIDAEVVAEPAKDGPAQVSTPGPDDTIVTADRDPREQGPGPETEAPAAPSNED